MTGYTVHTGSTEKFTEGWDRIFTGSKKKVRSGSPAAAPSKAKSSSKTKNAKSKKKG